MGAPPNRSQAAAGDGGDGEDITTLLGERAEKPEPEEAEANPFLDEEEEDDEDEDTEALAAALREGAEDEK